MMKIYTRNTVVPIYETSKVTGRVVMTWARAKVTTIWIPGGLPTTLACELLVD